MENPLPDVTPESSPAQEQEVIAPEVPITPPVTPPKGSQTPSENLYAALAEERRLRKEAEDKLLTFNTSVPTDEVYSDEGKALDARIVALEARNRAVEDERDLERLYNQYPLLKEKANEFNEYRSAEHPRAKIESVAKLFLVENGLLEPKRKGLESPTGGPRTPLTSGMTAEDVKTLRETNFRKYQELLLKGQIKVE